MEFQRPCAICGRISFLCSWETTCYSCNQKEYERRISSEILSGEREATWGENKVFCPYCGEILDHDGDWAELYEDGDHEIECPNCDRTFLCTVSISFSYETTRIDDKEDEVNATD